MVIVVYGPAGSGKTTVGRELARTLGWTYHEGDDFHPAGNVEKMRSGVALRDEDRKPWLDTLRRVVAQHISEGSSAVLSCSALKRSYRAALLPDDAEPGTVHFVYLRAERAVLVERLKQRSGHFFPAGLLDSQLADLQAPGPDEAVSEIDATRPVELTVAQILKELRLRPAGKASSPPDRQPRSPVRR
jgi:gluconokinase